MNFHRKKLFQYLLLFGIPILIMVFWFLHCARNYVPEFQYQVDIFVIFGLLVFTILTFLAAYYFRGENRKIRKATAAIKELGAQNFNVKIDRELLNDGGSVGGLARGLLETANKLQNSYRIMNDKVAERTRDLEVEVAKMELMASDLEKFKLAVDNASDHIIITNPDGVIIYANKMAEKITGYSLAEIVGSKAGKLWSSPMPLEYYKRLWDTIKIKKITFKDELRNRRKNGEIYDALASISPVLDKNKNIIYYVGIERDISKEKNIDRAKTEFVSLASHQLRSPLSIIKWYVEMLLIGDMGEISAGQRSLLDEVYLGNQRMIDLVNSLLSVSRMELGSFVIEPKKCLLSDIVNAVVLEQNHSMKAKSINFSLTYESALPPMMLDRQLMHIVIENLISNAIKYTPVGGSVRFNAKIDSNNLKIEVSDSGIGIPLADYDSIFTKLYRADNARLIDSSGNGLGLYLTKMILNNSGGSISFISTEDRGTTFTILIPETGMKAHVGTKKLE